MLNIGDLFQSVVPMFFPTAYNNQVVQLPVNSTKHRGLIITLILTIVKKTAPTPILEIYSNDAIILNHIFTDSVCDNQAFVWEEYWGANKTTNEFSLYVTDTATEFYRTG